MKKHAYLIMAHNNFAILEKLICVIDNPRNDIYVHIDKKVRNFDFDKFLALVKKSNIYFIPRIDTRWGDFSLVECELSLLKHSSKKKYFYYHLISGVDFPLKKQSEIHRLFDLNAGKEFVYFCDDKDAYNQRHRLEYYYYTKYLKSNKPSKLLNSYINKLLFEGQKFANVKRKCDIEVKFGKQWVSITHELVNIILDNEAWVYNIFRNTQCANEHFVQMIIEKEKIPKEKLFGNPGDIRSCLRYIDIEDGIVNTFKKDDFESLVFSDRIFARKFDEKVDLEIIDKLYNHIAE